MTTGSPESSDPNPFRYGGQVGYYTEMQAATGALVLCGARWYQSNEGRLLRRDPAQYDGGWNLYEYCGGNPVNAVDPSGLQIGGGALAAGMRDPVARACRTVGRSIGKGLRAAGRGIMSAVSWFGRTLAHAAINAGGRVVMDPKTPTLQTPCISADLPESRLTNGRLPVAGRAIHDYIDETGGTIILATLPFVPKLGRIFKELPIESGECSTAATKAVGVLRGTYPDAVAVRITDAGGAQYIWSTSGKLITRNYFHDAVFANGRFFDALTGPEGLPPAEYFKLFKDLYPVVRRR